MAEYIERDAVISDLEAAEKHGGMGMIIANTLKRYVKRVPSADVAPVVRCKDCKFYTILGKCKVHSQEPDQYGPGHAVIMASDDFCSYGKRK